MNLDKPSSSMINPGVLGRPVGRLGLAILTLAIAIAPSILFFDPIDIWPGRGHIARDAIGIYRLWSDDVAYVASSRTWERTVSSLFLPHNTHIVPAWRILTWALVACSGNLERLPTVPAIASYSILVAAMLMTGRLVARETGRTILGLVSMALVGTTSLMLTPALWYSAGQPLWAGLGILATLWYAQSYRRSGRWPVLVLAAMSAPIAGWFWTVGHMAGPAAAVYLWVDGRRRCKLAASVPLAATILAVALSVTVGARRIDGKLISLDGRTIREAVNPFQGVLHTLQAIPGNLILGNLGLNAQTTPTQGNALMFVLIVLWAGTRRHPAFGADPVRQSSFARCPSFAFNPLECAGATVVLGSYLIEWSFRGYADFDFWRTINIREMLPWYDAIPQVGAVLFAAGWWSGPRSLESESILRKRPTVVTRRGGLGLAVLLVALIVLNRPRVDELVRKSVPPLLPSEAVRFPIPRLQTLRASGVLVNQADWQRSNLRRLDRGEEMARRMGLGRDAIRAVFGHPLLSGSFGRKPPTELLNLHDAPAMLNLPERGSPFDPATVRNALTPFFAEDKEPRPSWIAANEPWPPDESPPVKESPASHREIKTRTER
jgi:hypothetical protein